MYNITAYLTIKNKTITINHKVVTVTNENEDIETNKKDILDLDSNTSINNVNF